MTNATEPQLLLTRAQIRRRLPISDTTLYRWILSGDIPRPRVVRGRDYWPADEFAAWFEQKFRITPEPDEDSDDSLD